MSEVLLIEVSGTQISVSKLPDSSDDASEGWSIRLAEDDGSGQMLVIKLAKRRCVRLRPAPESLVITS